MSRPGAFRDAATEGLLDDSADFVIVGSGAGGGAAARVLAEAGHDVVVLEEGPMPRRDQLSPLLHEGMAMLYRGHGRTAAFGRATTPILQGRCVGGTTFVNSAIIWRLPEKVLAAWHAEHGLAAGLPAAALDDAHARLEDEMRVRPVPEEVAGRNNLLMREGAERAGIEHRFIRRSESGCRGSGRCLIGCPNDAKQSTTINYLGRAVADGARVYANAQVKRVVMAGDRAVAVRGVVGGGAHAGRVFRVAARKAVVLCASVVQTPNLLRRSGLRRPGLGDGFMAHPGTGIAAFYPDPVNAWLGAAQGYEAIGLRDTVGVKLEAINVPPEVAASRMPGAGRRLAKYLDRMKHLAIWACAIRADAVGTIRPSFFLGDKVSYTPTAGDLARARQGMKALAQMHFEAGAIEVLPNVFGLPEVVTRDQLAVFDDAPLDPRAYGLVATHLFGGCRAGKDPARSVVDPTLRVHGTQGLYVMDASIFPSNTGVNPQHSIMAIATVAARRLASA